MASAILSLFPSDVVIKKGIARQAGCARVHWLTHETNSRAMLLYERVAERSGFVQFRTQL